MGIGGSYSDRLLSANQFTMGDEYTVRGFKESSVVGIKVSILIIQLHI